MPPGRDPDRDAEPPAQRLREWLRALARSRAPLARWTRTLGLATLVGWLGGFAALALVGALHAAIPLLIGNFARPEASGMFDLRFGILLLPALGALV